MPSTRNMTTPVFEKPELTSFPASPNSNAKLLFGLPNHAPSTQALQLGTNSDILFGRADDGMTLDYISIFACRLHLAANGFWPGQPR